MTAVRTADAETSHDVGWTRVCHLDQIEVEGGVTALVGGRAVAVFRTFDGEVFALDNYDPCSRASVLSRGIVGTRTVDGEAVAYVASPVHKQGFDLRTGQCLDDAAVRVATYDVLVTDLGEVLVRATRGEPTVDTTADGNR